ncbi:MAG TPA: DEAD/DEAH box helicase [Acidiferrobacterales bacterium]
MDETRFHPAVADWFNQAFPAPTPAQTAAWPAIQAGRDTLIAAPTGSGKTLAAFLAAIDALTREALAGALPDETRVVYVSPLKALSNDIHRNLEWPLAGIRAALAARGLPDPQIRALVRTGDTTPGERQALIKRPPHILVTTPESLYLLLTSESGRKLLATTRSVIVDEIHAVAGSKRGAHLMLSLERLAALTAPRRVARIGLSATQKPVDAVARFLTGGDSAGCRIVDVGHGRERDLAIELPDAPLEAVMSTETWEQVYDRLAARVGAHRTTLVFVNTRRLAERVTRHLSERLGKQHVTSHHGSLAKEQRLAAEQRLKAGELKALVATASLELGIDIGEVDLVCQLGSPRAIATFLQRVGRSGHAVGATPKGRLFPLSRDELVECAALLDAVARGELDRLVIPGKPLDVLAQQIVAEVAARDWHEAELYECLRRAWPYRNLTRAEYDAVVRMLADGFSTRRGRRSAYLHRDAVHGWLRARKGARLTALTCGGAIPDNADYAVVLEPGETFIGTLNEDFAIESMAGDIFQLGNASYRILRIETGKVRVEDARGAPPTIPFWIGEAPARSDELSEAVSRLRAELDGLLAPLDAAHIEAAVAALAARLPLGESGARQLVEYLAAARGALGVLPTRDIIVLERFFDETGGMQLILHAPLGSRVNRAWGLALRKRFCRKFNFELQAAATEDAIVLSLGETHSFPLEEVAQYLHSTSAREVLVQALLTAPLFTTRWRWAASIALAIKRFRGGRKNPPQLQRIEAEDLIAVTFPDQIACAENLSGAREVPDHPLVNQTIADCLHEAMDVDGLIALLADLERGARRVVARDLPEPSPLAQEILNAKPYAFLDDAPLEERRTQAVASRRWLDPLSAADIGRLDPAAIAAVRAEAWPDVDSPDELHDALMLLGALTAAEGEAAGWRQHLDALIGARRATVLSTNAGPSLWVAAEQLPMIRALNPAGRCDPDIAVPAEYAARAWEADAARIETLRGRLQGLGPVTTVALAAPLGIDAAATERALLALEAEGFALRGRFTPTEMEISTDSPSPVVRERGRGEGPHPHSFSRSREKEASRGARDAKGAPTENNIEWCERRLLARIHRYTIKTLRAEIEPVSAQDYLRFLFDWHGITRDPRPEGAEALQQAIEQLEGYEAASAAWEGDILPARLADYDPQWLDGLCLAGRALWARLTPPKPAAGRERGAAPVRSTPIALLPRRHVAMWRALRDDGNGELKLSPRAEALAAHLAAHGASFFEELMHGSRLLKSQTEEALAELVAAGRVHADSFAGLRALLIPADRRRGLKRRGRRIASHGIEQAGRWSLWRHAAGGEVEGEAAVEHIARVLLKRYGVVFRRVLEREGARLPPWYALLRVYRRLEARGEIRGGRFVSGFSGEQYALPEAVGALRAQRKRQPAGNWVSLSAADPLNLVGIVTPGARVPALAGNRVLYRDGLPVAVQVGGEARFLIDLAPGDEWGARNALLRPTPAPAARAYLN